MFNFMHMLEHLCPGIGEITRIGIDSICRKDEAMRWLRAMACLNVQGIRVYSVVDQPYCTTRDLMELDTLLAERRELECSTFDCYVDMHRHYEAAFVFVQAGAVSGIRYTLADYGRKIKWDRKSSVSQRLAIVLREKHG